MVASTEVTWRIYIPVYLDAILILSKIVFLGFGLLHKFGGVRDNTELDAQSPLLSAATRLLSVVPTK
jgi:hypothetical protein